MAKECHGCGSALKKSLVYYPQNGNLQKGFCDLCYSWNYFDIDGFYADPPSTVTSIDSSNKFRSKSIDNHQTIHDAKYTASTTFCDECTRNQTIVMQIMANYLPSEDDPDYQLMLRNSQKYKKDLEARYPLVCSTCLPNVERKLLKVNKRLWSMVKSNADPKTVASAAASFKRILTTQTMFLLLVLGLGWILFNDILKISKLVKDAIILGLIVLLFYSTKSKKTDKVYPPTTIKLHGKTIGTQSEEVDMGLLDSTIKTKEQDFSLNSLTLSQETLKSKSGIFKTRVGEPVRVPWHISSFQTSKTDVNPTQVRLDSNPQMINPKAWAKSAFMQNDNHNLNIKNSSFNLGPDLFKQEKSRSFEIKRPTFAPPSEITGLEDLISSSFHIKEESASSSQNHTWIMLLSILFIILLWIACIKM